MHGHFFLSPRAPSVRRESTVHHVVDVVVVEPLHLAKGRLASVMSAPERRALVLAMLGDVLAALDATDAVSGVIVVSRDAEALALAARLGASALLDRSDGLNSALAQAAAFAAQCEASALLALPADLPARGSVKELAQYR